MSSVISTDWAWIFIAAIIGLSVLACLNAIALVLGRGIALHNLRVETHSRRNAAMERVREIRQRKIMSV